MSAIYDAEVIKVVNDYSITLNTLQVISEVLGEFSNQLGVCYIRVNHSKILNAVIDSGGTGDS